MSVAPFAVVAKVVPVCGAQVIAGVRHHDSHMLAYALLLAVLHLPISIALGAAYFWRHGPSRLGDVLALLFVSIFVTWLFHTRRRQLMTKSEVLWFLGFAGCYVFGFETLGQLGHMEFARSHGQLSLLWLAVSFGTVIGLGLVWIAVQLVQAVHRREVSAMADVMPNKSLERTRED